MKKFLSLSILFLISQLAFSQWTQQGADIDGEAFGDNSGYSVSLSGDGTIVAIGAYFNNGNGDDSGHTRVYQFDGVNWNQLGNDIDGEVIGDQSGYSVNLSNDGTIVAIGAIWNNGNGINSGHVRVYQFNGADWVQLGGDIDGEAAFDGFGYSVSLSNDGIIVAIGATANDDNGMESGHVRVYQFNGANWNQLGSDIDGEAAGDQSGYSVSLNGDGTIMIIGAVWNDGNGNNSGHARIYEFNGVNWVQLGGDIDGEEAGDAFGASVSINNDGSRVAIGAPSNNGNGNVSGHVRVYQFDGANWNQLGGDIDGEMEDDESGGSVSLSSDGNILAVGAADNDGNEFNSGHVRVYQFDGIANWTQLDEDINGELAGDHSGGSVSLNNDGSMVAVGAIYNDGNGVDSGHTRIFSNLSPTPNNDASVAIGTASGFNITTGNQNVFAGDYSGFNTTEGSNNTFTGYQSGFGNTTGNNNTFIGQGSGLNNQTGHNNTAIGRGALENNQFGRSNTALGHNAGTFGDNFVNTTAIGSGAQTFASNQVRIGNPSVVSIGGFANWSNLSDGRFKKNIKEDIPGLDFITRLRPVSYEMDHSSLTAFFGRELAGEASSSRRSAGFIAQEVAEILKAHGYEFSGVEHPQHEKDHYGIRYAEFVVPLVKGMQEQQQMIASLKEEIEILKKLMNETNNGIPGNNDQTGKEDVNLHGFSLNQNIPNPFYQTTVISMLLPEHVQQAGIMIYNLQGLELEYYELKDRGQAFVEISAERFPSGMYLYALIADGEVIDVKKMILTK